MNSIVCRDPFDCLPLERMFTSLLREPFFKLPSAMIEEGTLPIDLSEDDRNVYVRASLPGFKRDEIEVQVQDGVLSINARQEETTEESNERYYRKERRVGSVSRRIALPTSVEDTETSAELKDGVLTVRIPKSPKATPRKVKIG